MKNTTARRAQVGQYAMVRTGVGQLATGTLYEASRAAINEQALDIEVGVIRRDAINEYRYVAFFCPVRQMIVATSRATAAERTQIEADFGVPPAL